MRIKRDHLWTTWQMRERRAKIVRRSGADVAKILRNNKIGTDRGQCRHVHTVEAFTALEKFADLPVNRRRAFRVRNARHDQNRFAARLRWKIALVADAGDLIAQPQREQDFRRGGQQGTNLHGMQFITVGGIAIILELHSNGLDYTSGAVLLRGYSMDKLGRYVLTVLVAAPFILAGSMLAAQQPKDPKTYSLKPTPKTVAWGYYDASTPPALRVQSGDKVEVQTLPAGVSAAQLEAAGVPPEQVDQSLRDIWKEVTNKGPGGHILTGPIYVDGAQPGDRSEERRVRKECRSRWSPYH